MSASSRHRRHSPRAAAWPTDPPHPQRKRRLSIASAAASIRARRRQGTLDVSRSARRSGGRRAGSASRSRGRRTARSGEPGGPGGVKWTCQRGRLASPSRTGLVLWVAPGGVVSSVRRIVSAMVSWPILRGAPGRGSSSSPSRRCAAHRRRHFETVLASAPTAAPVALFSGPSAAANTIRARRAIACPVRCARARDSSPRRSVAVNSIATAVLPITPSLRPSCRSSRLRDQGIRAVFG